MHHNGRKREQNASHDNDRPFKQDKEDSSARRSMELSTSRNTIEEKAMTQKKRMGSIWAAMLAATTMVAAYDTAAQTEAVERRNTGGIAEPIIEGLDLEMVQKAWQTPRAKKREGQSRPGAKVYRYCPNCVYRVETRIGTTTSLRVDPEEIVVSIVNGNPDALEATGLKLVRNVVEIRPKKVGIDTSVKLYTASERSYIFWIATEDNTAESTSDLVVDVLVKRDSPTDERAQTRPRQQTGPAVRYSEGRKSGDWETLTQSGREMEQIERARINAMKSPVRRSGTDRTRVRKSRNRCLRSIRSGLRPHDESIERRGSASAGTSKSVQRPALDMVRLQKQEWIGADASNQLGNGRNRNTSGLGSIRRERALPRSEGSRQPRATQRTAHRVREHQTPGTEIDERQRGRLRQANRGNGPQGQQTPNGSSDAQRRATEDRAHTTSSPDNVPD